MRRVTEDKCGKRADEMLVSGMVFTDECSNGVIADPVVHLLTVNLRTLTGTLLQASHAQSALSLFIWSAANCAKSSFCL